MGNIGIILFVTFRWFISLFMCSNSLFSLFLSACICNLFLSMILTAMTFFTSSASQPILHTANAPRPSSFVRIMYFPIYFSLFSISYLLLISTIIRLTAFMRYILEILFKYLIKIISIIYKNANFKRNNIIVLSHLK